MFAHLLFGWVFIKRPSSLLCKVLNLRVLRKVQLDLTGELPGFLKDTAHIRNDPSWRVSPVPDRLHCRHVDVGDLSPCDTQRLITGLKSTAQGLQVGFSCANKMTYTKISGCNCIYFFCSVVDRFWWWQLPNISQSNKGHLQCLSGCAQPVSGWVLWF